MVVKAQFGPVRGVCSSQPAPFLRGSPVMHPRRSLDGYEFTYGRVSAIREERAERNTCNSVQGGAAPP